MSDSPSVSAAGTAGAAFPATRWSLVVLARSAQGDEKARRHALNELCRSYWFPLYAFARRQGSPPDDAEDATQSFFVKILGFDFFDSADPDLGRLRSFLLKAFSRHLLDLYKHHNRQRRGGGAEFISLDLEEAEARLQAEVSAGTSPEAEFARRWALTILDEALEAVAKRYADAGKQAYFAAFRPYLSVTSGEPKPGESPAELLGMEEAAVRQAVMRLRRQFRIALRAHVAETLREPTDERIDEELAALHEALSYTSSS
jgi:RNA polymerase sigma factor (sigma-70 family)